MRFFTLSVKNIVLDFRFLPANESLTNVDVLRVKRQGRNSWVLNTSLAVFTIPRKEIIDYIAKGTPEDLLYMQLKYTHVNMKVTHR